ncbi:hypothetical protein [Streptomyces fuscichromogenes]|nr:hypothetical protein [Streptomyces fuscichromogenes]
MTRTRPAPAASDADRRLGEHLPVVVRSQDTRIPARRRAPRTVAEMRARLAEVRDEQSCGACQGSGGHTETTSSGGVTRQNWVRCDSCKGSGSA